MKLCKGLEAAQMLIERKLEFVRRRCHEGKSELVVLVVLS